MKNLKITLILLLLFSTYVSAQMVTVQGTGIVNESVALIDGTNFDDFEIFDFNNGISHKKQVLSNGQIIEPTAKALGNSITFTRKKSANSLLFHDKIVKGTNFAAMKIWFSKPTDTPSLKTYLKYELNNVFVVRIQEKNDFYETIEVVFKRLKISYSPVLNTGALGPQISYGWDFETNSSF